MTGRDQQWPRACEGSADFLRQIRILPVSGLMLGAPGVRMCGPWVASGAFPSWASPRGLFLSCLKISPLPESSTSLTYLWGDLPWGTVCNRKYLLGDCLMSAPRRTPQGHIFVCSVHHPHLWPSLGAGTWKTLNKTLLNE